MQLENLQTKFLGRNTIYYKEIDSTQKEIWRLIDNESIIIVFIPIPITKYFTFSQITLVCVRIPLAECCNVFEKVIIERIGN